MLEPPPVVLDIFDTLERAGYDTWCVGGAVRDALLGLPNADWDLATAATPREVMRLFKHHVPLGVEHGTVGVLDRQKRVHEVTTFRTDVETDGRHAVVKFGASLDEDLARRDFTINAIAYKPRSGELRDPFGGRADLDRHLIRAVGSAPDRMREDRLRALRAIRFAARFEFDIDPATWSAILDSVPALPQLSAERVKQELEKTMEQVPRPSLAIERWRGSGALAVLIPELAGIGDLTIASLDCLPMPRGRFLGDRKLYRLTALFWSLDGKQARLAAERLRFARYQVRWIESLTSSWIDLRNEIETVAVESEPSPAQVRHWVARIGRTETRTFWRIVLARWAATRSFGYRVPTRRSVRRLYGRALRAAFWEPIRVDDLAINGNDLLHLLPGLTPGPQIRRILQGLLDYVLDDPTRNDRAHLIVRARQLYEHFPSSGMQ